MIRSVRWLTVTSRLGNRGPLGGSILGQLAQLRDTTKLHLNNDIVILDTSRKNKKPSEMSKKAPRNSLATQRMDALTPTMLQIDNLDGEQDFSTLLEHLRPANVRISESRYKRLCTRLMNSFSKTQLRRYIQAAYESPEFTGRKQGVAKRPKAGLIEIIINDLWQVERTGEINSVDDLYVSERRKVAKQDLFLLLLEDGFLMKYLGRTGCQVTFDSKTKYINFRGTQKQIDSANVLLDSLLNKKFEEQVDLSTFKTLYHAKYREFDIQKLSLLCQVYFKHVSADTYSLTALNQAQVQRAKRLLLWQLDHNSHAKSMLKMPQRYHGQRLSLLPFKDDSAVNWCHRPEKWATLATSDVRPVSQYVEDQLQRFSDESLVQNSSLVLDEINEIKSVFSDPVTTPAEPTDEPMAGESVLTASEIDEVYGQLTDFTLSPDSVGVSDDKLTEPLLVVTLGKLLFNEPKDEACVVQSGPAPSRLPERYIFNSNIPLVGDKMLSMPLFHNPELTRKDINSYRIQDPHEYLIHIKFQPSIVQGQNVNAPPVYMIFNLNKYGTPEMETLKVLTVENENSCYVPLPDKPADLKITSQQLGDMFPVAGETAEEPQTPLAEIQSLLQAPSSKYQQFNDPGLEQFLARSNLTFNGSAKPRVHETLELNIAGSIVKYNYVSLSYIRQLEFLYRDKLLQLNVIETGTLGGRRTEVTLCGEGLDRASLQELVDDSVGLMDQL